MNKPESIHVRDLHASEVEEARQFLCAHGWAGRMGNPVEFAALVVNTQRTAVALAGAQIVGFARGITDGLSNGYLSMVVVAPEYRRQGVGRDLVQHVMGDNTHVTWVLRAGRPEAPGFFAKLGFVTSSVAMERLRA